MIRNAIRLRERYQTDLQELVSLKEVRAAEVLPNPTIDFIGESWGKLPLNFIGIIGAVWAVLKWTGVGQVMTDALK